MPARPSAIIPTGGRGRTESNLSRQFSDTEALIDGRLNAVMQEPALRNTSPAASVSSAYNYMKQDLEMRAMVMGELDREREIAYSQSARMELARQAEKNDFYEQETTEALQWVNERVASGTDHETAVSDYFRFRPSAITNPSLASALQIQGQLNETPEEAEVRKTNQAISFFSGKANLVKAQTGAAVSEALSSQDNLAKQIRIGEDTLGAATADAMEKRAVAEGSLITAGERIATSRLADQRALREAEFASQTQDVKEEILMNGFAQQRDMSELGKKMSQVELGTFIEKAALHRQQMENAVNAASDEAQKLKFAPLLRDALGAEAQLKSFAANKALDDWKAGDAMAKDRLTFRLQEGGFQDVVMDGPELASRFGPSTNMFLDSNFWAGRAAAAKAAGERGEPMPWSKSDFIGALNVLADEDSKPIERKRAESVISSLRGMWAETGDPILRGAVAKEELAKVSKESGEEAKKVVSTFISGIYTKEGGLIAAPALADNYWNSISELRAMYSDNQNVQALINWYTGNAKDSDRETLRRTGVFSGDFKASGSGGKDNPLPKMSDMEEKEKPEEWVDTFRNNLSSLAGDIQKLVHPELARKTIPTPVIHQVSEQSASVTPATPKKASYNAEPLAAPFK